MSPAARQPQTIGEAFDASFDAITGRREGSTRPQALTKYQDKPIAFMSEELGIPRASLVWSMHAEYEHHRWDGTPDPLVAAARALRDWKHVGIESGTGTGKSYWAAGIILWFLASWDGARVFTFAPKEDQLRLYIWAEIGKMWPAFKVRFPEAELTDLTIRMLAKQEAKDTWGAVGYAVGIRAGEEVATKAAGMHAEHMLLVVEEMPGTPHALRRAHENTCVAAHNLRVGLGNPDNESDALHQFSIMRGVQHVRISAHDHPNVVTGRVIVPGAVERAKVEERALLYGEDSTMYESRVRGLSPKQSAEAMIRWEWCVAASKNYGVPLFRLGKPALGVDVAASVAGDEAAIARGNGAMLEIVDAFACPDSVALGLHVHHLMRTFGIDDEHCGIDPAGVGAGTVGKLVEVGHGVKLCNSSYTPENRYDQHAEFTNFRCELLWTMREDLRQGFIAIPKDEELWRDLCAAKWKLHNGKVWVEPKEDIKERLGRSPNKGDAAMYWNYVRSREAVSAPVRPAWPSEQTIAWAEVLDYEIPATTYQGDGDQYGDQLDQG